MIPPCPHTLPAPAVAPCVCDFAEGMHAPECRWFDASCDAADYGPPEVGPAADEYDWLMPDGPEDPDRCWSGRDAGE